jgi:hypothetical protein
MGQRFSVQAFLAEMRAEQREDHNSLSTKVDEGFKAIAAVSAAHELEDTNRFNAIDKRLVEVENTRRTMRWLGATAIAAFLAAAAEFLFVLLPKLVGVKP